MGPCIAGGAYLPALSDVIIMVENVSFLGLGGPNLVKGATGSTAGAEALGGASMHTVSSGVAHYRAEDDAHCLELIRQVFRAFPPPPHETAGAAPALPASELYETLPADHRLPYDVERIIGAVFDGGDYLEFQPEHAPEMLCAQARLNGHPVALVANRRGFLKTGAGAARRRHHLYRIGAQGGVLRGQCGAAELAPDLPAGRLRLYGRRGSGSERHHPRRGGDGGNHVLRDRPQDRFDPEPRQRSGLLRDGRSGVRSSLHARLADRAHRGDGGRIRRCRPFSGRKSRNTSPPGSRCPRTWSSDLRRRAPITIAGWRRPSPRRAAMWTR